jgi:hypothetical protein
MKQDRFLTGILIGIGVLVLAAVAIFVTRRDQAAYVVESTPDAVVHNYVLALLNKDYPKAYGYLAALDHKPTLDEFRQSFAIGRLNPGDSGVKIGSAEVTGDNAAVEVSMVYTPGDPFSSSSSSVGSAQLVLQNGAWKISSMPAYNLWDYGWYQAPPK